LGTTGYHLGGGRMVGVLDALFDMEKDGVVI